jgi:hypothetical protein
MRAVAWEKDPGYGNSAEYDGLPPPSSRRIRPYPLAGAGRGQRERGGGGPEMGYLQPSPEGTSGVGRPGLITPDSPPCALWMQFTGYTVVGRGGILCPNDPGGSLLGDCGREPPLLKT